MIGGILFMAGGIFHLIMASGRDTGAPWPIDLAIGGALIYLGALSAFGLPIGWPLA